MDLIAEGIKQKLIQFEDDGKYIVYGIEINEQIARTAKMADLVKVAEPYVACSKGCSACCQMNVMIFQIEANFIEKETGIKQAQVRSSLLHPQDEFIGVSCPFLEDGSCSIYDVRPFACRKHLSFDTSPYWCDPARTLTVGFPMLEFSGAQDAFLDATRLKTGSVFADIRDFFTLR